MEPDLVVRGGSVIDGSGAPARVADVAVAGGRIVAVEPHVRGREELDASGCVVSPGFVDVHTHYDAQVFWDPWLTPSAYHGVTTVVAGNCGFSIAPVRSDGVDLMARTLQQVEDMSFDTLLAGVPWDEFESFSQYLDAVERRGVSLNYACYVGHTAVRLYVMGDDAYERAATPAEISRMQEVVADAMAGGAVGFATSNSATHNGDRGRPVPSRVADAAELRALLQPVKDAARGVVELVPKGIALDDLFTLQREIGRPFTWTAMLTVRGNPYHEALVAQNDDARARGFEVWPQVSCRPLVFQINMADPFTMSACSSFKDLVARSHDERVERYQDPEWRRTAFAELGEREPGRMPFRWPAVTVAESDAHPELIGQSIVDLAAARGCTPLDVMLDLSLEEDLRTRFWCVVSNDDEDAIAELLPRDNVLIALADSGAHVSQLCDACFTSDLLGNWVRSRGVMSLERAVHKLTSEPAAVFGIRDRGTLAVGKAADVCVFDPEAIAPGPLRRVRDFPAGGERLTADAPEGIVHVLVNGVPIRRDGRMHEAGLAARPGAVLRDHG